MPAPKSAKQICVPVQRGERLIFRTEPVGPRTNEPCFVLLDGEPVEGRVLRTPHGNACEVRTRK